MKQKGDERVAASITETKNDDRGLPLSQKNGAAGLRQPRVSFISEVGVNSSGLELDSFGSSQFAYRYEPVAL